MIKIVEAIHRGAPFFSFVIGVGIAALLFHRDFMVVRTLAMPLEEVLNKTVKVDGKCYKYLVEDASCEISSST